MLIEALPSPLALNAVTGVAAGVVEELLQDEVIATAANTVSHFRVMSIHHCHAVSTRVVLRRRLTYVLETPPGSSDNPACPTDFFTWTALLVSSGSHRAVRCQARAAG